MNVNYEKGKVSFSSSQEEITVMLERTYTNPVVKVTASSNDMVFLKEVQNNFFKVCKSSSNNLDIYYVVIEGS